MNLKPIPSSVIAATVAIVLLTLAPARTQAQPTTLNFALTATYQQPDTNNAAGNLTLSTTKTVKWTPAILLAMVTNALGTPFPRGSYLAQDNGSVEVITDRALDSTNVDSLFTFDTSGTQVFSGTANSTTSQQSASYLVYATASFDDGQGNSFHVDGVLRQTVSVSAQDANGNQTESISFSGNVAGYGTVLDKNSIAETAIFTGVLSGAGKGAAGS